VVTLQTYGHCNVPSRGKETWLTAKDRTQRIIDQLAEVAERYPDAAGFYAFHQTLLRLQSEAKAGIRATLELADERGLKARSRRGLLLISFPQLPIQPERFARLATDLAAVLVEQDPNLESQSLPGETSEWLALAEKRFEEGQVANKTADGHEDQEPEPVLADLAADLALQPYLQWAAAHVLPHVEQAYWKRNYCPVCGGAPDFALLEEGAGARHLICSRCDSEWLFRRLGCAFCDSSDFSKLVYYPSDDEVYRLYVCQSCNRYLKAIDLRKVQRQVLPEVERVASLAMDLAAQQEGYR
jgi:FdhE protein